MAKKRGKQPETEPALPKFGGFKPLAGLQELKDKLAAETAASKPTATRAPAATPARKPEPAPKRTAASEAEDELAFHRMMSGVTPLGSGAARVPVASEARIEKARRSPADLRAKAEAEAVEVLEHLHHLVDDVARFEVSDDGKHVEGRRADAPPDLVRSLRRGLLPIDARIDLHGLGANEARERLAEFLKLMRSRGERCILVIHGKGAGSPGGIGVLRGEISAWLSQGRAREHVAAFVTAKDGDGGEGALYVALRR